jgi:hypothetical protein
MLAQDRSDYSACKKSKGWNQNPKKCSFTDDSPSSGSKRVASILCNMGFFLIRLFIVISMISNYGSTRM